MSKTNAEKLATFKKANKVARQRLAERAGYSTAEDYRASLEGRGIVITEKTVKASTKKESPKTVNSEGALDMVIAFDTTGSMSSYIGDVKKHVSQVVNDMFDKNSNLLIKIVAFGDYCDMKNPQTFGNAYQVIELTNDRKALIEFIGTARNTSGCDGDEFYEVVIQKVVNETAWREGAGRSFLLIGDADPHLVGYSDGRNVVNAQVDWKKECEIAKQKNVKIDTLSIHGNKFYKDVSEITGGINIPFKNSKNVSQVVTGLSYARSGSADSFNTAYVSAVTSGDEELIGAYKSMSTLL